MKTYSRQGRGNPISSRQIKIIHTLKNALDMDEETYRAMLWSRFEVNSSKSLSWRQAEDLIDDLQLKKGTPSPAPKRAKPFADLDGRPGMATGAQCRLIAAMWGEVSRAENAEARAKALDAFIKRIAGVDSNRFETGGQVEKIVKAITEMKRTRRW
jgi:hypothetical protein